MKKSVKKAETTVNIAPQSPVQNANSTSQGYAIPDAEMLRRKYGIQSMEETNKESRAEEKNYGDDRVTELASTVEVLRSKLDEKNRKIEHLCTLLESLEPVSGIDAERIQQAMLAPQQTSGDAFDLRDSKIVSLAKKSHNLTMQLNKERGTNERLRKDLEEANRRLSNMEAELELQKSRAKSESTSSKVYNRTALEERGKMEEEEEKNASIARNLKEAQRSVEELKRRVKLLSDEKKELTRKLAKEIGDGTEGAEGLEKEGWKGRAQLIVVLRSRIKALESQLGNGSTASTLGQRVDVDARAEENLVEMTKERRQAVEALTEERLQLIDQVQSLEKKGNAFKV